MPCWIRSHPLQDLDQVVRIEHRRRILCSPKRDWSGRVFRDRLSVNEAAEVLGGMLNTHRCFLESGVEIQKRLKSHPVNRKMGIFWRPHSASLRETPKSHVKGEKRAAISLPQEKLPKRLGKGSVHPFLCCYENS